MNPYKQYKLNCAKYNNLTELKQKVNEIIGQKQLSSIMNDTKWIELQSAVNKLLFPPPFILKCITDTEDGIIQSFNKIPSYLGDWSSFYDEGLPPFIKYRMDKSLPEIPKVQRATN